MAEHTMQYMRAVVQTDGRGDAPSRKELLEDTSLAVPFVASTEGVKADGLDLKMEDWDLKRFKRYGPILWLHNYWRPPIGTGRAKAEDKLLIDVHFDEDDEFAMGIRSKAIKGMMAGSVGWTTIQGKGQTQRNQLMEFSMTPMGLDPDALPAIGRMTESIREGMTRALSNVDEAISMEQALQEIREQITAGLQEVLDEFIAEDERTETEEIDEDGEQAEEDPENETEVDDEREGEVELTDSASSDHVVTTTTTTTTTSELEPEETHLFWDGENMVSTDETVRDESPEGILQRAGAVLSKKNRDDLEAARELIAGVIDRATPDNDEMLLSLEDDDERAESAEAADDGLGIEQTEERDEDEGLSSDLVQQIEELLST